MRRAATCLHAGVDHCALGKRSHGAIARTKDGASDSLPVIAVAKSVSVFCNHSVQTAIVVLVGRRIGIEPTQRGHHSEIGLAIILVRKS